eukprot:NODE_3147_length_1022_cov_49.420112_g3003_i0.p1 GENE.NODE_3147_length_1022_cov_49.420112_g3003_i0~~NODE_3147_length_1022_cov_49.420112_g3003_i0.p1  ORF type:complete len:306 (-),score=120.33 NODE_3147_length_1022_cov_49.420112_g3003_i0:46-963(-)
MSDDLYDIRNALLLGNYAQVISDGSGVKANPYRKPDENEGMLLERDGLVFKAHVGLGQNDIVIDDLASTPHPHLKAVRLLAQYLKHGDNLPGVVADAKELLKEIEPTAGAYNAQGVCTLATILIHAGELELALKALQKAQQQPGTLHSPDLQGLIIDVLLRIHRTDMAEKELKKMEEDTTMTELCAAWIALAHGGDKIQDALQIFEDLTEKFGSSVVLANGMAFVRMAEGNFEAAEKLLLDAMSKRANDPETLVNLIACTQHLKKPMELSKRYITQLKTAAPHHPWVLAYLAMENKFDTFSEQYA